LNNILRDLIDIDNITAFINILVATNSRVGYNKLVNEILKRINVTTQKPLCRSMGRTIYWVNIRELDRVPSTN